MKHLRLFKTEAEYDAAVAEGLDYPNVTFVEDEGSVIYKRGRFDAVDLGLPSGTLWASCNVGANSPEEAGQYFRWAEVVGNYGDTTDGELYNWKSCPYQTKNTNTASNTKYFKYLGSVSSTYKSDSATDEDALKTRLDSTDDAAAANMESGWQMPTKEDFEELLSQCDVAWTTLNGVSGSLLTSNINGETLFFPATGYRNSSSLENAGSSVRMWSCDLGKNPPYAAVLTGSSSSLAMAVKYRYYGYAVRGVRKNNINLQ